MVSNELFDLNFGRWQSILLALIPAVINLGIFIYVVIRLKKDVMVYSFAIFLLSLTIWQFSDALSRMSVTTETATLWNKLLAPGALLIGPVGLHFTMCYSRREKLLNSFLLLFILYFPVLLFENFIAAGLIDYQLEYSEFWGWIPKPSNAPLTIIEGAWISVLAMIMLGFLFYHAFEVWNNREKRMQTLLMAFGFATPVIQGIFTQVILPSYFQMKPIPVASSFMTFFSIAAIISLVRYKFLRTSLQIASKVVLETITDILMIISPRGELKYINSIGSEVLGIKSVNVEQYSLGSSFYYNHDEFDKFLLNIRNRLQKGNFTEGETVYLKKPDQSMLPVLISGSRIPGVGDSDEILLIARDITERQKSEEDLRRQTLQYESLLRAQSEMGEGIAITEGQKFIYVNDALCKIYGYSQNELYEMNSFFDMVVEDQRDILSSKLRRRFEANINSADHGETAIKNKSGTVVDIAYSLKAFDIGEKKQIFSIIRDITEIKATQVYSQLALAATQSNNSVIIWNKFGLIEWVNEGFTKLSGYQPDEVLNSDGEILLGHDPVEIDKQRIYLNSVLREKKAVTYEIKKSSKLGKNLWVIRTMSPIIDSKGNIARIIVIESDVTTRKKMEEELLNANMVAEQSALQTQKTLLDLIEAKSEVERMMKVKEQFLANMSHEIRTPMNAIIGFTGFMNKTSLTSEQKQYLEVIKTSGENLMVIINDILDFSKIQSGKIIFEQIELQLPQIMSAVNELLLPKAIEKNIKLSYSIDPLIPEYLIGDPTRLTQILINLIGNSVKFTEKGEVKTNVEFLGCDDQNVELQFTVSDTGVGIPREKLDFIFEGFSQASSSTTRQFGGTGLGLAIVKQLIELQDGEIKVKSKQGIGSEFSFKIKFMNRNIISPKSDPDELVSFEQMGPLDNLRVLLVEDNKFNQMLASKILSDWNCVVEVADNGRIALEILENSDFDIILMDIQMPEMDGYEATRCIRNNFKSPKNHIPIIALTAHAISGETDRCHNAGMNDYISKPFNEKLLYSKIYSAVFDKKN